MYRTKRGEKEEREIVDWRTDAQHDREARCIAFANPGMADSIIHRFANSSNIGGVAVALQPLRHLST